MSKAKTFTTSPNGTLIGNFGGRLAQKVVVVAPPIRTSKHVGLAPPIFLHDSPQWLYQLDYELPGRSS